MPQRTRVTKCIGRERRYIMSLLGWIITFVGGLAIGTFDDKLGLSGAKKWLACVLLAVACLFIFPNKRGGGFSNSAVEEIVKYELIASTNYDNIHVLNVHKVNEEDNTVTFEWKAEFRHLGALCRQSGFIYFYRNGDVKDFVKLNDIHVVR